MKILVVLSVMLHGGILCYAQTTEVRNVSAGEFKKLMDSLKYEVVLDLRTGQEIEKGKIRGAVVIDFYRNDFESALSRLDRSKPYLLYCAGGGRSAKAGNLMKRLGFKTIYNLESGYDDWVKSGMPVEVGGQ